MKNFVYNTYFRKHERNKHVSATKPLSFSNSAESAAFQRQCSGSKKWWITIVASSISKAQRNSLLYTLTFHHSLAISIEYSPNGEQWGGGHGIDSDSRDARLTYFTLKNSPRCPSVNRIIAPPTTSPDAKVPGWTKIKCLWKMVFCPSASICSGLLCFSHLSLFSLEPHRMLPFTPGTRPHSPGCVWVVLVTYGATREKEITYWFSFLWNGVFGRVFWPRSGMTQLQHWERRPCLAGDVLLTRQPISAAARPRITSSELFG